MLFSVITICKNNLDGLIKTVESVENQEYEDFEHIIIDGSSTDGSKEYALSLHKAYQKIISEHDTGISNAFNKGLKLAKGDYILFLNTGDTFLSNDVLNAVSQDIKKDGVEICTYISIKGKHTIPEDTTISASEYYWNTAKIPHQGSFVSKKVFDKLGGFDESLRLRMDYDFFYRVVKNNISHKYYPRFITQYEDGGACMDNALLFGLEGCQVQYKYDKTLTTKVLSELTGACSGTKEANMFLLLEKIVTWFQNGDMLSRYLLKNNIKNVAIYGYGRIGKLLSGFLNSDIHIEFYVDRLEASMQGVEIRKLEEEWKEIDAILLTQVDELDELKHNILCKGNYKIISLFELEL